MNTPAEIDAKQKFNTAVRGFYNAIVIGSFTLASCEKNRLEELQRKYPDILGNERPLVEIENLARKKLAHHHDL